MRVPMMGAVIAKFLGSEEGLNVDVGAGFVGLNVDVGAGFVSLIVTV